MKTITLTKENYELLIGCIEESIEAERKDIDFWQAHNNSETVELLQKDLDRLQNLLEELK